MHSADGGGVVRPLSLAPLPTRRPAALAELTLQADPKVCLPAPPAGYETPAPTMLSRGEFGILGMERILALLGEHGVSGSFFIPGHTIETFPEICRRTHAAGHEIAHHGWTHRRPDDIYNAGGVDAEREELVRGIEAIKSITGAPPTGYRSPAWDLSPATLELLIELGRCNEATDNCLRQLLCSENPDSIWLVSKLTQSSTSPLWILACRLLLRQLAHGNRLHAVLGTDRPCARSGKKTVSFSTVYTK